MRKYNFQVDLAREKCLVKFLDNTSAWSSVKELTKLAMPDSDVMCVLCKKSRPKTDNDIIVCDKCGRGYHQLCHQVHNELLFIIFLSLVFDLFFDYV